MQEKTLSAGDLGLSFADLVDRTGMIMRHRREDGRDVVDLLIDDRSWDHKSRQPSYLSSDRKKGLVSYDPHQHPLLPASVELTCFWTDEGGRWFTVNFHLTVSTCSLAVRRKVSASPLQEGLSRRPHSSLSVIISRCPDPWSSRWFLSHYQTRRSCHLRQERLLQFSRTSRGLSDRRLNVAIFPFRRVRPCRLQADREAPIAQLLLWMPELAARKFDSGWRGRTAGSGKMQMGCNVRLVG